MWAAFLLPHLRPGMRLLDCGSGVGSITVDLAEVVAPGEVVGIDISPVQVEQAKAMAAERKVSNVRFQVANIYELPFPDASFEVAYANAVLEHLPDPLKAMREVRRVLKPGGIFGVQDPDYATRLEEPSTPLLQAIWDLANRIRQYNGSSLHYARHQRRLLLEAGFARSEGSALAECTGDSESLRPIAFAARSVLTDPANVELVTSKGWADEALLEAMVAEWRAFSERPDAYRAIMWCSAVGWTPE